MKASEKFYNPTTAINQLWQTDFTYLRVTGWGWYYLSTVMDDYSRYIVSWCLCTGMAAKDVFDTLRDALVVADLERKKRPRLLSDNGPCYISGELKTWLKEHDMDHTRGKRWHRTMKDKILLDNYYLPGDLECQPSEFITNYNTRRHHKSINNLTPEDVWLGRGQSILEQRRKTKENTMKLRKQLYWKQKAA